mmetsp:Transcript_28473/g.83803  ORF Transcript_28473/g.83803 Transcript_28473/m.83803 type:complete len:285 (+) Transcript_28473:883-1737(+)
MRKMAWLLEDCAFISVEATMRFSSPEDMVSMSEAKSVTMTSRQSMCTPPLFGSSLTASCEHCSPWSRSRTTSLYTSTKLVRTRNSRSGADSMWRKMHRAAIWTMPSLSIPSSPARLPAAPSGPCMVYVFPEPVWPYAKIVPSMPPMAPSTTARHVPSKTSGVATVSSYASSKEKSVWPRTLGVFRWATEWVGPGRHCQARPRTRSSSELPAWGAPSCFRSLVLRGRKRMATLMESSPPPSEEDEEGGGGSSRPSLWATDGGMVDRSGTCCRPDIVPETRRVVCD